MIQLIRAFLAEPELQPRPHRTRWDWVFLAMIAVLLVAGIPFEPEVAIRPLAGVVGLLFMAAVWLRRKRPFLALVIPVSAQIAAEIATFIWAESGSPFLGASFLAHFILVYAVWRWAAIWEAVVGTSLAVLMGVAANVNLEQTTAEEIVGTISITLVAAAVGAAMRSQARLNERNIEEARMGERNRLARELHDTVAHHVSAIAVQAQAGRAIWQTSPERGAEILATIDDEAATALEEMKWMVQVMRDSDNGLSDLEPAQGLDQLHDLASPLPGGPPIEISVTGNVEDLEQPLGATLYRLAQESITNARRHAKGATAISVNVIGREDSVHLSVTDNGLPASAPTSAGRGLGLVGMAERVALLGGSFQAQPRSQGGWAVVAELPRSR